MTKYKDTDLVKVSKGMMTQMVQPGRSATLVAAQDEEKRYCQMHEEWLNLRSFDNEILKAMGRFKWGWKQDSHGRYIEAAHMDDIVTLISNKQREWSILALHTPITQYSLKNNSYIGG